MTTWREVDYVRTEHPKFTATEIALALGCAPEYVRATAYRRGWELPSAISHAENVHVVFPRTAIEPLCLPGETPRKCAQRIITEAINRGKTNGK